MGRKAYETDLSNAEWRKVEMLIPPTKPRGRPRTQDMREIINVVFYILAAGCAGAFDAS